MPIRNAVIKTGRITANGKPIYKADIQVYQEGKLITNTLTDQDGEFKVALRSNQDYTFMINKINFFRQELKVSTFGEKGESELAINVKMRKLQTSQSETVKNVYFEYNKWGVNFYAKQELDRLAEFLKANPRIKEVEITAHTDNRGSEGFNQKLSQKRAEACVAYLISVGVPGHKLKARGYGEMKPIIESPLNEDEHSQNRRVEFEITKIYR